MKVLDPFAGYRLSAGHPIFHFSLFVGSYAATIYASNDAVPDTAFMCLRWGHFTLIMLGIFSIYSKVDSEYPLDLKASGAKGKIEVEKKVMEHRHRDGVWKIAGRVCDTLAVFAYTTTIFFV